MNRLYSLSPLVLLALGVLFALVILPRLRARMA